MFGDLNFSKDDDKDNKDNKKIFQIKYDGNEFNDNYGEFDPKELDYNVTVTEGSEKNITEKSQENIDFSKLYDILNRKKEPNINLQNHKNDNTAWDEIENNLLYDFYKYYDNKINHFQLFQKNNECIIENVNVINRFSCFIFDPQDINEDQKINKNIVTSLYIAKNLGLCEMLEVFGVAKYDKNPTIIPEEENLQNTFNKSLNVLLKKIYTNLNGDTEIKFYVLNKFDYEIDSGSSLILRKNLNQIKNECAKIINTNKFFIISPSSLNENLFNSETLIEEIKNHEFYSISQYKILYKNISNSEDSTLSFSKIPKNTSDMTLEKILFINKIPGKVKTLCEFNYKNSNNKDEFYFEINKKTYKTTFNCAKKEIWNGSWATAGGFKDKDELINIAFEKIHTRHIKSNDDIKEISLINDSEKLDEYDNINFFPANYEMTVSYTFPVCQNALFSPEEIASNISIQEINVTCERKSVTFSYNEKDNQELLKQFSSENKNCTIF